MTPVIEGLSDPYVITPPLIKSGSTYCFSTDSGIEYEVKFGRKEANILHITIAFGVLNEEFEGEEYIETNRGEVYRVMATIIEIARMFNVEHLHTMTYEFTGERKDGEQSKTAVRTRLYYRYIRRILNPNWKASLNGDSLVIEKVDFFGNNLFSLS